MLIFIHLHDFNAAFLEMAQGPLYLSFNTKGCKLFREILTETYAHIDCRKNQFDMHAQCINENYSHC